MLRPSSVRAFARAAPPQRCSLGVHGSTLCSRRTHNSGVVVKAAAAAKAEAIACPWSLNRASGRFSPFSTLPVPPSTSLEAGGGSGMGGGIRSSEARRGVGVNYPRQQQQQQQQLRRRRRPPHVTDGAQPGKKPWARDIAGDVTRAARPDGNSDISGISRSTDGYSDIRNTSVINSGATTTERTATPASSKSIEQTTGASAYVSQAVIRRLATARRQKNWRAALSQLEEIEREAAEVRNARMRTRRRRGGRRGGSVNEQQHCQEGEGEHWRVWCVSGACSKEDVERARTTVYNMVMDILGARKRWQEAFMLLETMQTRGVVVDIYTLNSILKACGAAGRAELVLALLKEMRIKGGPRTSESPQPLPAPDTISYNIALSTLARAGETSLALSLFDEMVSETGVDMGNGSHISSSSSSGAAGLNEEVDRESLWPASRANLASYNAALSACARCGEGGMSLSGKEGLERAFEIFEVMRRGDDGAPSPDLVTYKEMITACGRAGHWDQALSWLDAAIEQGLTPNAGLFYEAIAACRRGGVWRRALSVLEHMQEGFGVSPDKFCSNMALRACADAGQVKKSLQILDEKLYGSMGASGFSYSPILDALAREAREGDPELALRLLREIRSSTPKPPNGWHYGSVFLAFLNAGHEPGALEIRSEWRTMQSAEAAARIKGWTSEDFDHFPVATGEGIGIGIGIASNDDDGFSFDGFAGSGNKNGDGDRSLSSSSSAVEETSSRFPKGEGRRRGAADEAGEGFYTPGDRFSPPDLVGLALGHADAGRWSECLDALEMAKEACRAARSGVLARTDELLLGGGEEGSGLAGWREVAARNSDATNCAEEAWRALRGCYEAAVEALGRAGRVEQSLELLKKAVTFANEHGFHIDPACFVPALRACGGVELRVFFDQSLTLLPPESHSVLSDCEKSDAKNPDRNYSKDSEGSDWDSVTSADSADAGAGRRHRSVYVGGKAYNLNDSDESDDWNDSEDTDWDSVARTKSAGANRGGGDGVKAGYLSEALLPGGRQATSMLKSQGKGRESGFSEDSAGGSSLGSGSLSVDERMAGVVGEKGVSLPCEAAASLLGRMEDEAGIAPDCWCVNVVMEAAILGRQWSLAAELFDQAYRRHQYNVGYDDRRSNYSAVGIPTASELTRKAKIPRNHRGYTAADAGADAGVDGAEGVGNGDGGFGPFGNERRGHREMRAVAVDRMAPNAVTYHLALQACASALADHLAAKDAAASNWSRYAPAAAAAAANASASSDGHQTPSKQHLVSPTFPPSGEAARNFLENYEHYPAAVAEEEEEENGGDDDMEAVISEGDELRFAARAVSLVRRMGKAGVRLRPETAALAQQVCARAGRMGAAIEIRQALEEEEVERKDKDASVGGGRWRLREKPERTLARY